MDHHHHGSNKNQKEIDHHHAHTGHHYLKNRKEKTDVIVDHYEDFDFLSFPRSTRISDKDEYLWPTHKLSGILNGKIKVKPL